jgi:hypothetical protein
MLIIDSAYPFEPLLPRQIVEVARRHGERLTYAQAAALRWPLTVRLTRKQLVERGVNVEVTEPQTLPPFADEAQRAQRQANADELRRFVRDGCNNPIIRGFALRDWGDWWPVFFYRFVDPDARRGENLNYAARIRTAPAEVLPNAWVVYHCPPRHSVAATQDPGK